MKKENIIRNEHVGSVARKITEKKLKWHVRGKRGGVELH